MSELKPCPFCGGEAKLSTYYDFYKVHCNSDDCLAGVSVGDAYNGVGKWYGSVAEAIAAWNTRAERTCTNTKMDGFYFRCSRCHATFDMLDDEGEPVIWWNDRPQFNSYCPNCGAKVVE